ncbi:hypothetical protein H0H92_008533 [Tricholoma furcatifolium]|nr:hypothetical protein H0H92_008533 [Tricholoma furcatifolium]
MPSKHVDLPELSSARINRLLRPLRSHCSSLVNYATRTRHNSQSSKAAVSNETFDRYPRLAPLSILPQPGSLESRQYLPHDAELARRIYAVRDCFQHIVINTKPHAPDVEPSRIQSLAALCSTIIGDLMEDQIESENSESDEDKSGDIIDSLYVAIPTEYRRCSLLSHALKLILSRCSDHPTLLMKLLDVTLGHHLIYESTCVLHAVICLAFSKRLPTKAAPICHSAHFNFFTSLYSRWISNGFSDSTFFRVLIDHLEESQDPEAWASRAVHDVVQAMHSQDFAAYLRLVSASLQLSIGIPAGSYENELTENHPLLSRTSEWLSILLELHPSICGLSDPGKTNVARFEEIGDMLTCVLPLVCRPGDIEFLDGLDIQPLLLSLSVAWLSTSTWQSETPSQSIIDQLSTTLPCPRTFTPLIAKIFTDSKGCLDDFRTAIQRITSALPAPALLHVKASLLGCALHYIEHPSRERELATKNTAFEVQSYRHQLINLVDDVENMFKMPLTKSSIAKFPSERANVFATPLRRELFRDISAWESKLGSCSRSEDRQLVRKRRKLAQSRYCSSSHIERKSLPFRSSLRPDSGQILDAKTAFMSLLSCAASRRATLHPVQETPFIRAQSEAPPNPLIELDSSGDELLPNDQHVSFSDDALDLFAWASSSPVK